MCVHQFLMITFQLPRAGDGGSRNSSLEYQTQSNQSLKLNRSSIAPGLYKGLTSHFFLHTCFKLLLKTLFLFLRFLKTQSLEKNLFNLSFFTWRNLLPMITSELALKRSSN